MCRRTAGLVVPDVSKDPNASSRIKHSKNLFSLVLFEPQDESTTILRNFGNHYRNERYRQHVSETSGITRRTNSTPRHVSEKSGTPHRTNGTLQDVSETSSTTLLTERHTAEVSEKSGTTHRMNGTPQDVSKTSRATLPYERHTAKRLRNVRNHSPNERHTSTHLRRSACSLANGCSSGEQL